MTRTDAVWVLGTIAAGLFAWDRHAEAERTRKWLDKSHENASRLIGRLVEIGRHLGVAPTVFGFEEAVVRAAKAVAEAKTPAVEASPLAGLRAELAREWQNVFDEIASAFGLGPTGAAVPPVPDCKCTGPCPPVGG